MAFHSRNARSRHRRSARNDKESILGLSGWLFADLLLAIAVIFLVVEARGGSNDVEELKKEISEVTAERDRLLSELESYRSKGDAPAEAQGLIADEAQQLRVKVSGGAGAASKRSFLARLENAELTMGDGNGTRYTWGRLKQERYRVGFIIWFAKTATVSERSANRHLASLVEFFVEKGVVVESEQWGGGTPRYSDFPILDGYRDDSLGASDLRFRIFLFKGLTVAD